MCFLGWFGYVLNGRLLCFRQSWVFCALTCAKADPRNRCFDLMVWRAAGLWFWRQDHEHRLVDHVPTLLEHDEQCLHFLGESWRNFILEDFCKWPQIARGRWSHLLPDEAKSVLLETNLWMGDQTNGTRMRPSSRSLCNSRSQNHQVHKSHKRLSRKKSRSYQTLDSWYQSNLVGASSPYLMTQLLLFPVFFATGLAPKVHQPRFRTMCLSLCSFSPFFGFLATWTLKVFTIQVIKQFRLSFTNLLGSGCRCLKGHRCSLFVRVYPPFTRAQRVQGLPDTSSGIKNSCKNM